MTRLAELNEMNETRNYLIDIHNNYRGFVLLQIINKIDDRYDNILKLASRNIMLSEEFNEIYSIANHELIYGTDEYEYLYTLCTLMAIIKKIIDYTDL